LKAKAQTALFKGPDCTAQ